MSIKGFSSAIYFSLKSVYRNSSDINEAWAVLFDWMKTKGKSSADSLEEDRVQRDSVCTEIPTREATLMISQLQL